jgi:Flp pilus assembly protein TadD
MSGKTEKEKYIAREEEWERLSENQRAAVNAAAEGYNLLEDSVFPEALAAFQTAANLWPGNPIFWYEMAALLRDEFKEYHQALWAAKKAVELDDEEPEFHHMLGNVLRSFEDKPGAVREYLRALDLDPSHFAYNNLGLTYNELGEFELARCYLETGLELTPEDSDLQLNLATTLAGLGYEEDSAQILHRCAAQHSFDPQVLTQVADQFRELDRFEETAHFHLAALQLAPTSLYALNGYGVALSILERYDEAEAVLADAIVLYPRNAILRSDLAVVLEEKGAFKEAIAQYRKAIELDPGNVGALYCLSELLQRLGRTGGDGDEEVGRP